MFHASDGAPEVIWATIRLWGCVQYVIQDTVVGEEEQGLMSVVLPFHHLFLFLRQSTTSADQLGPNYPEPAKQTLYVQFTRLLGNKIVFFQTNFIYGVCAHDNSCSLCVWAH